MGRRALIAAVAVLAAGLVLFVRPYVTAEREVTALTPAVPPLPPGSLVPAGIKPGSELCIRDVPVSPDAEMARVITATGGKPGPAFELHVGPRVTKVPAGWKEGVREIPVRPPAQATRESVCFRNTGTSEFALMASGVGQKLARPTPYLDGQGLQQDVPLVFHRAEPESMLSRTGALIDHAAVFSPLPAWVIWLLLVCIVAGLPIAAIAALALAGAADSRTPVRADTARTPVAPDVPWVRRLRLRERAAWIGPLAGRVPTAVVVALVVALAALFVFIWSKRVTTYGPDESLYVSIGQWLPDHLPGGLFELNFYQRGIQRVESWVAGLTLGLFGSPRGFVALDAFNSLAFASSAIPAYLVAKGLGVRKWFAVLAAVLVVMVPWTALMVHALTEPVAYPAFAWGVWATWRAVCDPRPATEMLAIGMAVAAALSRSVLLVLFALLPIAIVIQELRFGSLNPRTFVRRHLVFILFAAAGLVALVLSATGVFPETKSFTGTYGTTFGIDWNEIRAQDSFWGSRAVTGMGFIPFAVGGAWLVSRALRPGDARTHAFAVIALVSVVLLAYASKTLPGVPRYVDERYMMYLAPLLAIACAVALDRRDLRAPAVALGGLFGAWLVWNNGWNPNAGATAFFTAPAEMFYARVGLLRMERYVPSWISLRDFMFVLMAFTTAACMYAISRRPHAGQVRAVLIAALLLVQLAQAQYAIAKYVDGAGGRYQATLDQRAWIDLALKDKPGDAALLETGMGQRFEYDYIWTGVQFWNMRVEGQYGYGGPPPLTTTLGDFLGEMSADPETGRVTAKPPLPEYLVLPRDFVYVTPAGEPVVRPDFNGLDLWQVRKPDQLAMRIDGAPDNGMLGDKQRINVRFFAAAQSPGRRCGQIPLKAVQAVTGPSPPIKYRVGRLHGTMAPGEQITVEVPLEFDGKPYLDVPVQLIGKAQGFEGVFAGRILLVTTGPCGAG